MRKFTEELLLTLKLLGELNLREIVSTYRELDGEESEKTVRQMIHYLQKKGLIQKNRTKRGLSIYLTKAGLNFVNESERITFPEFNEWNMKWIVIFFDIPEKERALRDRFRRKLKSFGFGMLQNGVWFAPDTGDSGIKEFIKEQKVEKFTIIIKGKFDNFEISSELLYEKFQFTDILIGLKDFHVKMMDVFNRTEKLKKSFTEKLHIKVALRNRFRIGLSEYLKKIPPFPEKLLPDLREIRNAISDYNRIKNHTTQELFKDRVYK
ncbi:MAG: CRISPR-associated endonuclease Cas2 [bacterium]|nr:CRISPR-associated endonuclease Cas2 [bacterium]